MKYLDLSGAFLLNGIPNRVPSPTKANEIRGNQMNLWFPKGMLVLLLLFVYYKLIWLRTCLGTCKFCKIEKCCVTHVRVSGKPGIYVGPREGGGSDLRFLVIT